MWDIDINYWAVLVAGLSQMIVGFVWYLPSVAGNSWSRLVGISGEDMKKGPNPMVWVWTIVASIVTAYILAHFLFVAGSETIMEGLTTVVWLWVGIVVALNLSQYLFEKRPMKLFWINAIYHLIVLAVMSVVLVLWR
jgi:hypothetical protein